MIHCYFENIENEIISFINSSNKRINIAVAWFTNQALFDCLLNAAQKGIEIKIILLNDILNRNEFGLDFGLLSNKGANIRFAVNFPGTMHHKFCIIDNIIITGSYNWTYRASINNENIMITDDENAVNSYIEQFNKLFIEGRPITLPYEHLKWTEIKEGEFSELRRNIFRDVDAKNDENKELKKTKLIKLNQAFKNGNTDELSNASLITIERKYRTITDVLISTQRYVGDLYYNMYWDTDEEPKDVMFSTIDKWIFVPSQFGESRNHEKYIRGYLHFYKKYKRRKDFLDMHVRIDIYDDVFISLLNQYLQGNMNNNNKIPENLICINFARLSVYRIPSYMRKKGKFKEAIAVFCIAKEVNNNNIVYYEGWDPQSRKDRILKNNTKQ